MLYRDAEQRKEILKDFIRNNQTTTHREIRKKLRIKPEKVYAGGMTEAFRDAGVSPPRTFEMKDRETRKKILIEYLRKHPNVGMHIVNRHTKINYLSVFKNVLEFYREAGIDYLRREKHQLFLRENERRKSLIIKLIKENPHFSIDKISEVTKTHPYSLFKNINDMYVAAGIRPVSKGEKIRIRKRDLVISYIKNNTFATQRQINRACKTHVQLIFSNGIFEAYERAGVSYPYERIPFHGVVLKHIKDKTKDFEFEIASKLSGYGKVNRLVKTKRGIADILFERNNYKAFIEVKDYLVHDISKTQVNQLNKYLEDSNCNLGFLICRKKPSKDRFLIGKNTIYILTSDELEKISEVMDKGL